MCLHIMEMVYMLPASTFRLLEPLVVLMVKAEKALGIEVGREGGREGGRKEGREEYIRFYMYIHVHVGGY